MGISLGPYTKTTIYFLGVRFEPTDRLEMKRKKKFLTYCIEHGNGDTVVLKLLIEGRLINIDYNNKRFRNTGKVHMIAV